MRRCTRCVLTENHPDVWFNEDGVCNYCLEFEETRKGQRPTEDREDEFIEMLEKHRGQGEYDCLMMLSGGKDSTYALYLLKERYKLNVLGFTFDNGFETEAALENACRTVDALEVDYLYLKLAHMKRLFRFVLHSGVKPYTLCPLCKSAMKTTAWEIARKFGIGLIVWGDTKGQRHPRPACPGYDLFGEIAAFLTTQEEFRPFLPMYFNKDFSGPPERKEEKDGIRAISPYWWMKWDGRKAMDVLEKEVGWRASTVDYPGNASNCLVNLVSVYTSLMEYGFSFYDIEMSVLIRYGEITREEALQRLEVEIDPDLVDSVLSRLGLSLDGLGYAPKNLIGESGGCHERRKGQESAR